jgi:OmpA-OmpF porin, OOP family
MMMKTSTLLALLTLVPLCLCVSQEKPLVTKDKFIKELSRDYEPPPPGARGISVDPPPSVTVTLFFKQNSTELADEASLKQLQEAGAAFSDPKLKPYNFAVEGHCDSDGEDAYNLKLSQQRADAIVKMLTERYGVTAQMLEPIGKGETEPIADNSTDEGKQQNRRVVFVRK